MAESQSHVHVLILPYPAQGHMLPLLDLTHLLSTRFHLTLTIAVTPKNLPLLSDLLSSSPAVKPLVLQLPDYPSLPPGIENTQGLPISYFRPLTHALGGLHGPLLEWAKAQPKPPSAILSDFFCGWAHHLAAELGIPHLVFSPSGAAAFSILQAVWHRMPKRSNPDDPNELFSLDSLPRSPSYPWYQLPYIYRTYQEGEPVSEFIKKGMLDNTNSWGYVFNTFSELEGLYLDHLRTDLGHDRVWAVGPVAPSNSNASGRGGQSTIAAEEVAAWLDGCKKGSVVYACFGSQALLSPPQAAALAAGLEKSGARFLWCVKETTVVPEGFEELVAGRGLVIRGWAPQVAILSHGAVGSFVTHCGWNSVLEGAAAGVVLLTWPISADQFFNERLIVEEAGIGVKACEGGPEAVPNPDELARVITESVGEAGRERRERAKELGRKANEAIKQGGSSYRDLDNLVKKLSEH